jgi:endoglucanase
LKNFPLPLLLAALALLTACGTPAAQPVSKSGPVSRHGLLRVAGHRIVGADGQPASFAGNSFFWSQWQGQFYNAGTVNWLVRDWKSGIVRAALGITADGYLGHPATETARIRAVVDAAIAADVYVIIDWHDHRAHEHTAQAVAFFSQMARLYGRQPHVMYEIYNEPLKEATWAGDVKPYARKVIAAIRAIDPDNLIIVGSPNWSQDVDLAAADPIKDANVAYSLHFYAGTHRQSLRAKAVKAMELGAALFVTEWGTCNSDGNGKVDVKSTGEWMAFMRQWQLSHCNWSVADKREAASIVIPGASPTGGWADADLTPSGRYVRELIRNWSAHPGE